MGRKRREGWNINTAEGGAWSAERKGKQSFWRTVWRKIFR